MDPFVTFFMAHWELSGAFVIVLILIAINEWRVRAFGIKQVSPQDLVNLLNHESAVAVDIRPETQYDKGHIIHAMNLPLANLKEKLSKLEKYKSKPIVLVCTAGLEIQKAGKMLQEAGFDQILGLAGGMQAWNAQQLPVVKA